MGHAARSYGLRRTIRFLCLCFLPVHANGFAFLSQLTAATHTALVILSRLEAAVRNAQPLVNALTFVAARMTAAHATSFHDSRTPRSF